MKYSFWDSPTGRRHGRKPIPTLSAFGITPSTASRYLTGGKTVLFLVLKKMPLARVRWPSPERMSRKSKLVEARQPALKGMCVPVPPSLACLVLPLMEVLVATFEAFPPCWKEAWSISVTSSGVAFSRILTRRAGSIADWDFLGAEVLALARVRGEVLVPATLSFSGVGGLCICMCVDVRTGCGSAELPRRCRRRASAELLGRKPPCRSKRGHSKVGGQDRAQAGESAGRARPCAMAVDVEAAGCSRFL
jgi:hypothetical protein